jgi:predicted DNA binding CopG/RHH family protein
MKTYQLDPEEQEILKDIESGKYKTVKNIREEIKRAREYARNTINKTKNVNIRLSERDLQRLKTKAMENGLGYQTLVSAILHQYANEKIKISL